MLTLDQLTQMIGPRATAEKWIHPISTTLERYSITTLNDVAGFLANACHESQNFTRLEENLNYSSAYRINSLWPRRFSLDEAEKFTHNPKKLANRAYADRLGNGDEASGDGYRYRGRGLFQITGKDHYEVYGELLGLDLLKNPDLLLKPMNAALSAGAYWNALDLNGFHFFDETTRAITGKAMTGAIPRASLYVHFQKILGA